MGSIAEFLRSLLLKENYDTEFILSSYQSRSNFVSDYSKNFSSHNCAGTTGQFHKIKHQAIEAGSVPASDVLEIGVGNFEHVQFVRHFRFYLGIDIHYPSSPLCDFQVIPSNQLPASPGIFFAVGNAEKMDYPPNSFDRIVITCVILHVQDPLKILLDCKRLLKPSGSIDFYVPCSPGFIYSISQKVILFFLPYSERRLYALVNAIEHVNHFSNVRHLAKTAFPSGLKLRYWPFQFLPFKNLNLFCRFTYKS